MGKGEKKIEDALKNIKGGFSPNEDQLDQLKDMAEAYSDKSQDEVFVEIIELNKKLSDEMGEEEFQNKMKQIEDIRPMLNEEQGKKLDQVLKALNKSI